MVKQRGYRDISPYSISSKYASPYLSPVPCGRYPRMWNSMDMLVEDIGRRDGGRDEICTVAGIGVQHVVYHDDEGGGERNEMLKF
jgi:hypothetical protein